jgi:hypothetical protein
MGGGANVNEIILADVPLEALIVMANEAADLAHKHMVSAAESAWDSGKCLLAAKSQIPHGQWMAWVRANFDRDIRTAIRYMDLASSIPDRSRLAGIGSVRQALRLIHSDQAEAPEPEPAEELQEIESEPEPVEREPQERPSVRKVSAESRKVSESDRESTPEVTPQLVEEPEPEAPVGDDEVVLYLRTGQGYVVADADDVAVAALQLHDWVSLIRMAVMSVPGTVRMDVVWELRSLADWLCEQMQEGQEP